MEPRLGIYIHIPFCASKCGYCDFYSCAGAADRMADYQHALLEHIEESAGRIAPAYIDTVYFGGGTPSFYGAARLIELLDAAYAAAGAPGQRATPGFEPHITSAGELNLYLKAIAHRHHVHAENLPPVLDNPFG